MEPITLAGIIAGGATLAAGGAQIASNANINKKNRNWQSAEAQKTRQWQELMYQRYQSPTAQADQMAAAGMNPYSHTESPSSVGSGSTASMPSQFPLDLSSPIAGAAEQINNSIMQREQINQMRQQTESIYLDNVRKAFENGNAVEVYKKQMEILESELRSKILTEQEFHKRVDMLQLEYDQRKNASDSGINPYVDDHNESVARVNQIKQNIDNLKVDNEVKSFALETSKLYDRAFLSLDYKARKQEVQEFLDTSEVRVSLFNSQKSFAKLAVDAASRADALDTITNETQRIIAEQILDAAKDGLTSFDAVLLNAIASDPLNALAAIQHLIPNVNITNKNYSNTNLRINN